MRPVTLVAFPFFSAPRAGSRKQQLQGSRPPRLGVSKDSHKIDKKLVRRLNGPVAPAGVAAPVCMMDLEAGPRHRHPPRRGLRPSRRPLFGGPRRRPPPPPTESSRRRCCRQFRAPGNGGSHWRRCRCSNPSCGGLPWLAELIPCFLPAAAAAADTRIIKEELGRPWDPFALTPNITMPATLEFLTAGNVVVPDLKPGHGGEAPAGPAGGEAEPTSCDMLQGLDLDCSSIRLLLQHLLHVRNTISSSDGVPPCDAWFTDVKSLCSDAQESLEDFHYKMILAVLGVPRQLSPSPKKLDILSIIGIFNILRNGSRGGLSGAPPDTDSEMLSLTSAIRCILLCRGVLGIMSIVGPKSTILTPELSVSAFDDLTKIAEVAGSFPFLLPCSKESSSVTL
ncbi:hypothetical protein HU200_041032 [Digitaria exilis]|uniref:Uncharacterized protein n=1 Tax=Digitaria exilis TaxID=1010633 RepID=A0A835B7V8_9POAL|nr:hypothetical protein HU200_041032 [Digitaria exilis]